jgi:putative flippase GtrA
MRVLFKEAAGYAVASACALLLDISVLLCLVQFAHLGYELAACISFMCGAVVTYRVSTAIAFKQHRLLDRRAEFASFVAIGLVGLAVNAAVMYGAVTGLGLPVIAAKCIAAGFTFTCNFFCRRQLLFVARRVV